MEEVRHFKHKCFSERLNNEKLTKYYNFIILDKRNILNKKGDFYSLLLLIDE